MLLTKVILNDFGVYRGRNEFDFTTTPNNPIIFTNSSSGVSDSNEKSTSIEEVRPDFSKIREALA